MSSVPEIVPDDIPRVILGRVHDAVLRITMSRQGWHGPVESVWIRRVIAGGRSGALVLDVVLRAGSEHRQRVMKIGAPAEMAAEFANFRRFLGDYPAAVCAPIQEVTDGAREGCGEPACDTESVVYAHVEDYAGRAEVPAVTLEDVVREAFGGQEAQLELARGLIVALFEAMATPFHNRQAVRAERSLRDLNPTLGPDLVVEPGAVTAQLSYPEDVLQASLGEESFVPGTPIRLADPAHSAVRVVLRPPGDGDGPIAGVVVSTRFAELRARFYDSFDSIERPEDAVVADGVRTADPARGLRRVLTDPQLGRVRGVVHGDLNARNVMCVDGRPVLIDFARTGDDHPIFADAAWLEISLIRDVFGELPYSDLVRVQRLLALAARLPQPGADDHLAKLLRGKPEAAFRMLAKIRSSAARAYPREVVAWRDYLAQVHVAAYRTAKWEGEAQSAAKLRAVHAAAAVATEWLVDDDPFAHWADPGEVLECLASFADPSDAEAVDVVAGLVAAVDRVGRPAEELNLRELSDRYVARHFVADARELVIELSREHDEFLATVPEDRTKPLVLVGGSGSGKTRILRELAYRAAMDIVRPAAGEAGRKMPRLLDAGRLLAEGTEGVGLPRETLVLGAVRLLVDGVDDVPFADRGRLFRYVAALHEQFPRIAVVVASRDRDQAERAGLPTRQIDPWDPHRALQFIAGGRRRAPIPDTDFPELHRELGALGGATPGMLAMYADVVRRRGRTIPVAEVYHEYFVARLGDIDPTGLAEAAKVSVDSGGPAPPPEPVEEYLARGILRRKGGAVLFNHGIERDFFAAMALTLASEDQVRERARRFAWRPVTLLAARLPEISDSVVTIAIRAVVAADPGFAARLLRLRPSLPCCSEFVYAQSAILGDPEQGRFAALTAVEALKTVGTPEALRQLRQRLTEESMSPSLVSSALSALTGKPSEPEDVKVPPGWLRDLLGELLDVDRPPELLREVLCVTGSPTVRGLELVLGRLVTAAAPGVAQAAVDRLSSLKVVLPGPLRAERPRLVEARLAEIERLLPTLWKDEEIREARTERLQQLRRLDDPAYWLPRLYSYGIRHEVADRLEDELGDPVPLDGVRRLAGLDVSAANALAYRIIAEHPRLRDDLVFTADAGSPNSVLLIAAAAVKSAATVEHAAELVAQLAEKDAGERIEGMAALAHAVAQADPGRGFRVSRGAARRLRERAVPARMHWPWTTMLAYTRPDSRELDALLAVGAADAVAELAIWCTALDGAPGGEPVQLGDAARRFVLTDQSEEPVVRALALCAAGLAEGLHEIAELISAGNPDATASTISSGRYGRLELAPLAEILPAYGQLARRSGEADRALGLLLGVEATGQHPSVADGKAIALGYLGDWVPVVEAAAGDGGRLDTAARHTLRKWVPGPATSAGLREPSAIAAWLKRRLTDAALPAGPRSLTQELLLEMETRHGALLPD